MLVAGSAWFELKQPDFIFWPDSSETILGPWSGLTILHLYTDLMDMMQFTKKHQTWRFLVGWNVDSLTCVSSRQRFRKNPPQFVRRPCMICARPWRLLWRKLFSAKPLAEHGHFWGVSVVVMLVPLESNHMGMSQKKDLKNWQSVLGRVEQKLCAQKRHPLQRATEAALLRDVSQLRTCDPWNPLNMDLYDPYISRSATASRSVVAKDVNVLQCCWQDFKSSVFSTEMILMARAILHIFVVWFCCEHACHSDFLAWHQS